MGIQHRQGLFGILLRQIFLSIFQIGIGKRNNMHENREISCTSWSADQDRSAKATSRNADMYVPEKSDCAVLPVNQPNKGGQLSAEAGEGRAQTEENIVQSHMRPTQSGKRMSQGLHGVRQADVAATHPW